MGNDIAALYTNGRAKSPTELWSPEENEALYTLIRERNLQRVDAADFIRNGILTVEDYDKAKKENFEPTKLDAAIEKATEGLKDTGKKAIRKRKK